MNRRWLVVSTIIGHIPFTHAIYGQQQLPPAKPWVPLARTSDVPALYDVVRGLRLTITDLAEMSPLPQAYTASRVYGEPIQYKKIGDGALLVWEGITPGGTTRYRCEQGFAAGATAPHGGELARLKPGNVVCGQR